MTAPLAILFVFVGLVVSAKARLNAVALGQPVSMPWLGLIAAVVVLLLAAVVLVLVYLLVRDGPRLRPRAVNP